MVVDLDDTSIWKVILCDFVFVLMKNHLHHFGVTFPQKKYVNNIIFREWCFLVENVMQMQSLCGINDRLTN